MGSISTICPEWATSHHLCGPQLSSCTWSSPASSSLSLSCPLYTPHSVFPQEQEGTLEPLGQVTSFLCSEAFMASTLPGIEAKVLAVTHKTCLVTSLHSPPSSQSLPLSPCFSLQFLFQAQSSPRAFAWVVVSTRNILPPCILSMDFPVSFQGEVGAFAQLDKPPWPISSPTGEI